MNEELKIIIKAVADEAQKELEGIRKELEKVQKQGDKAGKELDSSLAKVGKGAAVAVTAVVALTAAIASLGKSSMEYQKEQAKLNSAFMAMGASTATASKTYQELNSFLGDSGKATEAAAHLAKLTTNEQELAEWTHSLQGVYATFGDSLPIESLAEAANETAKVGTVTGAFADALNWAGVSEDTFNAQLAATSSESERQALIRTTLNSLYGDASNIYAQNNEGLIAYNQSQDRLNQAMLNASKYITPMLTALSNLAAMLLQVLAPVIEDIVAIIIVFVQWISTAAKAIGSFFGAFSEDGATASNTVTQVSTNANKAATSVGNISGAFKDATKQAEKLKKQTAGFDELNVVSSDSGASAATGGGASAPAVSVPVIPDIEIPQIDTSDLGLEQFNVDLEEAKGRIEAIGILAGIVGTALLGWKIGNIIKNFDTLKGKIAKVSGTIMIVAGALLLVQGFSDAWVNGLDWGNFATIIAGIGLVVGGLALAVSPLAGAIGLIVGGILALVIGIKDLVTNGYSMEAVIMVLVGAIAVAVGIMWAFNAALLANPITWIVVAIAALVAAFIILWNECEGFRQFWINLWEGIKTVFSAVVDWLGEACKAVAQFFIDAWEAIKKAWSAVVQWFKDLWQGIKNVFSAVGKWFSDIFKGAWNGIKTAWSAVTKWFSDLWQGVKNVFSAVGKWFSDIFTGAWEGIKKAFSAVGSFFTGIWDKIKEIFGKVGSAIADAVSGAFKKAVNWVLEKAIGIINGFIGAINLAIGIINKIPGVELKKLDKLEVPQMAKGGIVDSATLAVIGERGKEAVMPLENNTQWMDALADKIAGRNASPSKIVLMLDGKELGWASINSINNITKQTGTIQLALI